jgi:DNA-binding GntR family transcriptional regulator
MSEGADSRNADGSGGASALTHMTKTAYVAARIRGEIERGRYKVGDRITTTEAAAMLGVSLTPVREAFAKLSAQGFLRMEPHRGATVIATPDESLEDIYAARAAIEAVATRFAATRITDPELHALGDLLNAFSNHADQKDPRALYELNANFHFFIFAAGRMNIVARTARELWDLTPPDTWDRVPGRIKTTEEEHAMIYDALRRRDAEESASLMERHILHSLQLIIENEQSRADASALPGRVRRGRL